MNIRLIKMIMILLITLGCKPQNHSDLKFLVGGPLINKDGSPRSELISNIKKTRSLKVRSLLLNAISLVGKTYSCNEYLPQLFSKTGLNMNSPGSACSDKLPSNVSNFDSTEISNGIFPSAGDILATEHSWILVVDPINCIYTAASTLSIDQKSGNIIDSDLTAKFYQLDNTDRNQCYRGKWKQLGKSSHNKFKYKHRHRNLPDIDVESCGDTTNSSLSLRNSEADNFPANTDPSLLAQYNSCKARYEKLRAKFANSDTGLSLSGTSQMIAETALDVAEVQLASTQQLIKVGNFVQAKSTLSKTVEVLDLVTDFIPGISLGKDIYGLASGKNLVTRADLTKVDYGFIIAGLFVPSVLKGSILGLSKAARHLKLVPKASSRVYRNAQSYLRSVTLVLSLAGPMKLKSIDQIRIFSKTMKHAGHYLSNPSDLSKQYIAVVKKGPVLDEKTVAKTFKGSLYFNRKLAVDEVFFKYHGTDNRTGRKTTWLVKNIYQSESVLREKLAILPEWNVKITHRSKFRGPAGTWVSEGLAATQKGLKDEGLILEGGDYQAVINNVPKTWILNTVKAF